MKKNYRRENPAPSDKPPHRFMNHANNRFFESFIDGTSLSTGILGNDFTCGQHGAARSKRGAKHAITTARRRAHKRFIDKAVAEISSKTTSTTNE